VGSRQRIENGEPRVLKHESWDEGKCEMQQDWGLSNESPPINFSQYIGIFLVWPT